MKSAKTTRRALLKSAGAAAAAAAAAPLAFAALPEDSSCFDNSNPLTDANIRPVLAVWLLITTNPQWNATTWTSSAIGPKVNLDPACVDQITAKYAQYAQHFDAVRQAWGELTTAFDYSGGPGCPTTVDPITALAKTAPMAKSQKKH